MSRKFKPKTKHVKAEKVKKEPNPRVRTLIASLFNNTAAYNGGRQEKGWVAALLFVFSIVIALIPAMVFIGKTKGSDSLKGSLYHSDVAFVKFVEKLEEVNVDLTIVDDGNGNKVFSDKGSDFAANVATKTYTIIDSVSNSADIPYYSFSQKMKVGVKDESGTIVITEIDFEYLRVYYTANIEGTFLRGGAMQRAESFLANRLLELKGDDAKNNVTTHLIIGRDSLYMRLYNPTKIGDAANPAGRFEGRTNSLPLGLNIRDFGKKTVDGTTILSTDPTYSQKVVDNFAHMQDLAYRDVKVRSFWIQTGIYAVIFVVIGLVMGLIIFVSTRGKMNPYRDLKFFESMKVGAWLLPTPALITLLLGFILPASYFQMIFIMTLGMRSVWLTMRTLSPQGPTPRN